MRIHFRLKHRGRLCCLLCFQGLCAGDILKWSCLHRSPALTPLKPPLCEEQPIRRKLPWRMGCAKGQDKIKKDYFVTHAKLLRMSRLTCTQTNKFIIRSKKHRQTRMLLCFFIFQYSFFILLRICDDFLLIYDAFLYGGASEKVQTSANTKKEQEILGSTNTLQLGDVHPPPGPASLRNDIIILWYDSAPYRFNISLFLSKKTERLSFYKQETLKLPSSNF